MGFPSGTPVSSHSTKTCMSWLQQKMMDGRLHTFFKILFTNEQKANNGFSPQRWDYMIYKTISFKTNTVPPQQEKLSGIKREKKEECRQ